MSVSAEHTKRLVFLETLPLFLGTLTSLRILNDLRSVAWIGQYLSTLVALMLIYPPVIHATVRKLPLHLLERGWKQTTHSLLCFLSSCLVIFPGFLLLNHIYQDVFFGRHLAPLTHTPWPTPEVLLVQLLLVAFPEELFFRGYLQTILSRLWPRKIHLFGSRFLSFSPAIPVTSFLFAFSHSVIALQWWHFAIFFPSLVFGWLREKTGGLMAPVLFHTTSNLAVFWIGNAYR